MHKNKPSLSGRLVSLKSFFELDIYRFNDFNICYSCLILIIQNFSNAFRKVILTLI